MATEALTVAALRLAPGQDLKRELLDWAARGQHAAACVLTCVGSLSVAHLRFAGRDQGTSLTADLEIVSLAGTIGQGSAHLHLSVSDPEGRVWGGHVLEGCRVRTTAELVLGVLPGLVFTREHDPATGYAELVIRDGA